MPPLRPIARKIVLPFALVGCGILLTYFAQMLVAERNIACVTRLDYGLPLYDAEKVKALQAGVRDGVAMIYGGADGRALLTDEYGQVDPLDRQAPAGTPLLLAEPTDAEWTVVRLLDSPKNYFTPTGLLPKNVSCAPLPDVLHPPLPSQAAILQKLKTAIGVPYIWGGNLPDGTPQLATIVPPPVDASVGLRAKWLGAGLDCSGLLFWATDGNTPRDTAELMNFGSGVPIAGKTAAEIAAQLQPLDLIVWPGHTLIALGDGQVIQSKLDFDETEDGKIVAYGGDVRISSAVDELTKILEKRTPADAYTKSVAPDAPKTFVVRRWYVPND